MTQSTETTKEAIARMAAAVGGVKNYAVTVKHVNPFEKSISILAEVYGYYDKDDPSILNQIDAKLVNLSFAKDNPICMLLAPRVRLLAPALGISKDGREIKGGRGKDKVYTLIGCHTAHIEVLNMPDLQQDVVKKSEVSKVMLGADAGLIGRILAKAKQFV